MRYNVNFLYLLLVEEKQNGAQPRFDFVARVAVKHFLEREKARQNNCCIEPLLDIEK